MVANGMAWWISAGFGVVVAALAPSPTSHLLILVALFLVVVGIWIPGWSLITRVVTTVIATLTAGLLAWLLIPWIQEQATTQVVASVERGVRNVWKQLHHERLSLTFDNSPLFTRARRD